MRLSSHAPSSDPRGRPTTVGGLFNLKYQSSLLCEWLAHISPTKPLVYRDTLRAEPPGMCEINARATNFPCWDAPPPQSSMLMGCCSRAKQDQLCNVERLFRNARETWPRRSTLNLGGSGGLARTHRRTPRERLLRTPRARKSATADKFASSHSALATLQSTSHSTSKSLGFCTFNVNK